MSIEQIIERSVSKSVKEAVHIEMQKLLKLLNPDKFMTRKEVADFLKVGVNTVTRYAEEGKLTNYGEGRDYKFKHSDVLNFNNK